MALFQFGGHGGLIHWCSRDCIGKDYYFEIIERIFVGCDTCLAGKAGMVGISDGISPKYI